MRLGFLGKGGTGKTSMSALMALYLEKKGHNVLAVDADLNVHQQHLLGLEGTPKSMYRNLDEIKEYVRGQRTDIPNGIITTSTPPSTDSQFIRVQKDDPFLNNFAVQRGNLSLIVLGTYEKDDPGCACYHGMLGAWCLVANHLLDGKDDYVVIDATAGIDNIATPLFYAYDVNFFVVEPTLKSIQVFLDFDEVAKTHGMYVPVILNKITSDADIEFIKEYIPEERIITAFTKSKHMKRFDQGHENALQDLLEEQEDSFEAVKNYVDQSPKDWTTYYKRMASAHNKFAKSWHNEFHKVDLTVADDAFRYEEVINRAA